MGSGGGGGGGGFEVELEVERVTKHDRCYINSRLWLHAILQPELYFVHRTNFLAVLQVQYRTA